MVLTIESRRSTPNSRGVEPNECEIAYVFEESRTLRPAPVQDKPVSEPPPVRWPSTHMGYHRLQIEHGSLCYLLLVVVVLPIVTSPIRFVLV
jgi:hypothetical protein